jgi:hypothetical protein
MVTLCHLRMYAEKRTTHKGDHPWVVCMAEMNRMRVGMGRSIEYDVVTCKEHKDHPSAPPTAVAGARPLAGLMYSERSATPPATSNVAHDRRLLRRAGVLVPVGDVVN